MENSTQCTFFVPSHENKNKTILITYPRDFDCRKTISNNPLCIVLHSMNSTITVSFFKVMFACT